jgi:hypothetical protein
VELGDYARRPHPVKHSESSLDKSNPITSKNGRASSTRARPFAVLTPTGPREVAYFLLSDGCN